MENSENNIIKKKRGGFREGGGRPKGSRNKANLKIEEILETEGANLVHQAVRLAKSGNSAVLCKLLDKVLPSMTENKNVNLTETFEDFILKMQSKPDTPVQVTNEEENVKEMF